MRLWSPGFVIYLHHLQSSIWQILDLWWWFSHLYLLCVGVAVDESLWWNDTSGYISIWRHGCWLLWWRSLSKNLLDILYHCMLWYRSGTVKDWLCVTFWLPLVIAFFSCFICSISIRSFVWYYALLSVWVCLIYLCSRFVNLEYGFDPFPKQNNCVCKFCLQVVIVEDHRCCFGHYARGGGNDCG